MTHNCQITSTSIKHVFPIIFLSLLVIVVFSSACSPLPATLVPATPVQINTELTSESTLTPSVTPQTIEPPFYTWLDPTLPDSIQSQIFQQPDFKPTTSKEKALLLFSSVKAEQVGSWTYLLVAPFYSRLDNIQFSDLTNLWKSGSLDVPGYDQLLMSEESKIHLSQFWGESPQAGITITASDQIQETIWQNSTSLAIIPFDQLDPSYKVISIDDKNPLTFSSENDFYPLTFPIYLSNSDPSVLDHLQLINISNYDHSKLTSVVLTGVTALVRDTAVIIEDKGVLYPADDIRDILLSADITHINNEVPFAEDCPPPVSSQNSLSFCSSDSYIDLLVSIGTDIVELSGDHFADHGPDAMLHTLDIYNQYDILTYGGGINLQAGLDPVIIEHNGNKIAFIGCNAKILERYATASDTNPGASHCNFEWMLPEVSRLSEQGFIVIATMQHEEIDSYFPIALQQYDFRRLSEAGASIVSGSQAHHPQGIELSDTKFIHYGLGNLFFDQWYLATHNPEQHRNKDKAFIDFHYFYDGKYINTRLIPLQFIDNAHPRVMTDEEEDSFLSDFFKASKWNGQWIYLFPEKYFDVNKTQ
jgi:hypothetical protein